MYYLYCVLGKIDSGVKLSVVVPQAIGISLRNRIGDSAREFLVVVLWGQQWAWYYWLALCFSLFLGCILLYVHPLTLPFICLTLGLLFTTAFSVYAGFWPKVAYIRGFLAKSRVYWLFHAGFGPKVAYIRRCSLYSRVHPPFWLSMMLWEVGGWVVSVSGSPWVLMVSIDYFFRD